MIIAVREKTLSKYKGYCLQFSYWKIYLQEFKLIFYLFKSDYWIYFEFALFGLIDIHLHWSKKTDHAGFYFHLTVLGLDVTIQIYDCRHWDDEKNDWCKYGTELT